MMSAQPKAAVTTLQDKLREVKAEFASMQSQLDRIEAVEKANHQMLQIMLDQLSKINKKLGID